MAIVHKMNRVIFPPDGLRYGSYRDAELTRRDERRCRRFRGRVRALFRRVVMVLKGRFWIARKRLND